MRYLVAVDSVHTAGAACDYLGERLTSDDTVTVLAVTDEDNARDAADAANVAQVRLVTGDVRVETHEGEPAAAIVNAAEAHDVDEIVVGTHGGEPGSGPGVGATTISVLTAVDVPVAVVPIPELDPTA